MPQKSFTSGILSDSSGAKGAPKKSFTSGATTLHRSFTSGTASSGAKVIGSAAIQLLTTGCSEDCSTNTAVSAARQETCTAGTCLSNVGVSRGALERSVALATPRCRERSEPSLPCSQLGFVNNWGTISEK